MFSVFLLTGETRLVTAIHIPGLIDVSSQLVGVGIWEGGGEGRVEERGGWRRGEGGGEGRVEKERGGEGRVEKERGGEGRVEERGEWKIEEG